MIPDLVTQHNVTCPSCWEQHEVTIDTTAEERSFIEDCTVCCNPMRIEFALDSHGAVSTIDAATP